MRVVWDKTNGTKTDVHLNRLKSLLETNSLRGAIVTACVSPSGLLKGEDGRNVDFVSRFFCPNLGIGECGSPLR